MSKQETTTESKPCCVAVVLDTKFFRALCDPNRIALLNRLAAGARACCVSELAKCCPTDLSVTSRHLACLRDAGILDAEKCGKEVRYTVRFDQLVRRLRTMADAIEACCPPDSDTPKEKTDDRES